MSLFESTLARIWPAYPIAHGGGGGAAATSNVAGLLLTGQAAGSAPTMTSAAAMVLTWQEAASKLAQSALGAKEKEQVWPYMVLAAAYGLVGFIALVQLVRIQRRVPEYGWTTQKVFHLLNFVVNAIRCFVFFLEKDVLEESAKMPVVKTALLDLPGLLFFTTYTLLVLFWAEIYHQARGLPMESLRPYFMATNAAIYAIQIAIWGCMLHYKDDGSVMDILNIVGKSFFACVSLTAAVGFILYGGRLFLMLRRFPIESRGRRKKLHEVGMVTLICFTCFTIRACIMAYSAFFNPSYDVDTLEHPGYDAIYYSLVELIPSALVLYILRKLPPKRNTNSQTLR